MTARRRVRLRTIAARQVWDGRKARGGRGFIPGVRHFQAGVRAWRAAAGRGDADAAARLLDIDEALDALDRSLVRWRRGLAAFAAARLAGDAADPRWRRTVRLLRIRAPETRRLAALVEAYDDACRATATVTAACRRSGIPNPHRAAVAERRRGLRALIELGHGGTRLRRPRRGRAAAGRDAVDGGKAATGAAGIRVR